LVQIILSLITAWIIGWCLGLVVSAPFRSFPPLKQFIGYSNFALRMSSGMFFCITMLPLTVWPYFTWNPLFQTTELVRDAWFEGYVSPVASPMYVAECTLVLLFLGLSVERHVRRAPKI